MVPLTLKQVGDFWEEIQTALAEALPLFQGKEQSVNRILRGLLEGFGKVWVLVKEGQPLAIVITSIYFDGLAGTRQVVIYALKALGFIDLKDYKKGLEQLKEYAKGQGCTRIVAYTDVERIKQVVRWLGGSDQFTFVALEV